MVTESNKIVNGLWIGETLSALELLTLRSFARQGHTFRLWTYGPLQTPLPESTILADANEILDDSHVFFYRHGNVHGHGKGSVAGFSDVFRYKLLHDHGGWWADMDITCLRPLDFPEPYVFRNHDVLPVVGNLMKCPKGSELMKACFDISVDELDAENRDWLRPITILNEEIERLDLLRYVKKGISNEDRWDVVDEYRQSSPALDERFHVIHWMNEEWRSRELDKNACIRGSLLSKVARQNGVRLERLPTWSSIVRRTATAPIRYGRRLIHRIRGIRRVPQGILSGMKWILGRPRWLLSRVRAVVHFLKMHLYMKLPNFIRKPLKWAAGKLQLDRDPDSF